MTTIWAFLGDGAWQFVGHLIALASLLATIFIYVSTRSRKELSYSVVTVPLIVLDEGLKRRLQLLCDGKERDRVSMVAVVIRNTGTIPILRADFDTPICLSFLGHDSEILDAVWQEGPSNVVHAGLSLDGNRVTVVSTLLNPGEQLCFQLMVSGDVKPVQWQYRIVGIPRMLEVNPSSGFQKTLRLVQLMFALLSAAGSGFVFYSLVFTGGRNVTLLIFGLLILAQVVFWNACLTRLGILRWTREK